ncbi:MAG: FG-GAP-like repeat-containing protein [bacterium]
MRHRLNRALGLAALAVAASLAAVISVSADVTFTPYTVDAAFDGPGGVYAKDIDGDGDCDLVAGAGEGDQIAWWRNDGGSPVTWTKQIIADAFGGAVSVDAADVDGDLKTDVLGAGWYRNQIAWWKNGGGDPIVWTKQAIASGFTQAHEVYACDLDRDGDMDAVGAGAGNNTIAWWRNDGGNPIVWTAQVLSSSAGGARSARAADLDGDLDIDVVGAALTDNEITWWRNDGGSPIVWTEITITAAFGGAHMVRTCDMDLDGDLDLVAAAYTADKISWWRNDGGSPVVWTELAVATGQNGAVVVCPADIDGDGDPDILGTAQDASDIGWWENGGGSPIVWTSHPIDDNFAGVWPGYATDIDGDLNTDVVAGAYTGDEIRWWRNDALAGVNPTDRDDAEEGRVPRGEPVRINSNSPNPFSPATTISFDVASPQRVELAVYSVEGRLVRVLVEGPVASGTHSIAWDGLDSRGTAVASGLYFYRITAAGFHATHPMVLVR